MKKKKKKKKKLLGPLLFLLFVNNLPDRCSSSNVACFADDTKIYKLIDSVDDSKALQSDLDSLTDWSTSTFLQFNQQKCKSRHITRKRNPTEHQYLMNGSVLDVTTAEKDLGVWISSDLTWTNQVYHQSNKANKLLGFIRRSSRYIRKSSTIYVLGSCTSAPGLCNPSLVPSINRTDEKHRTCPEKSN